MPSITRLARIARIATLPETRLLIAAASRSKTLRGLPGRAVKDPLGLMRDVRRQGHPRDLIRSAARHPAVRELARASFMFLPLRYGPLGWAATWLTTRVIRRFVRPARDDPG